MKNSLLMLVITISVTTFAQELKTPAIFADGMVVQREMEVPIWGHSDPEAEISLSFAGQTKTTKADKKGMWMIKLDPLRASAKGRELTITAAIGSKKATKTIKDVLVGEVWLLGGQSNMEWPLKKSSKLAEVAQILKETNIPLLKQYGGVRYGKGWKNCEPANLGDFSAVGFYFGRKLVEDLKVPVALLNLCYSGTSIETWTPKDALRSIPYGEQELKDLESDEYKEQRLKFDTEMKEWQKERRKWLKENKGKRYPVPGPKRPEFIHKYNLHRAYNGPEIKYNEVLKPVIPYALRGALWYQGEHHRFLQLTSHYKALLINMAKSWRERWGQGEFPFFIVQLPKLGKGNKSDYKKRDGWSYVRDQQRECAEIIPNSGLAVTLDTGDGDLHPQDKSKVGKRLALLALKDVYNQDIAAKSPSYESMKKEDGKIILSFKNVDGGLKIIGDTLKGFAIAGSDQKFIPAQAKITAKNQVTVWNEKLKDPQAVRYAWTTNPFTTLYNESDLPAGTFRTDDWPIK